MWSKKSVTVIPDSFSKISRNPKKRKKEKKCPIHLKCSEKQRTYNFIFLLSVEGSGPLPLGRCWSFGLRLGPACGALVGRTTRFKDANNKGRFWLRQKLSKQFGRSWTETLVEVNRRTPTRVVVTHHILKRQNTSFC